MSQDLVSDLGIFWLLLGVAIFVLIVWRVYKPSRKREMEEYGQIPLEEEPTGEEPQEPDEEKASASASDRKGQYDGQA